MKTKLKQKIPLIILIGIILGFIAFMVYPSLQSHPLGEKLEYIGKESSGSWLPMSSATPSDLYYYATDLTAEEIVLYFPKAKLSSPLQKSSEYASFDFITPSDKKVTATLYLDKNTQVKNIPDAFKSTDKQHLFTVADYNYTHLKKSL